MTSCYLCKGTGNAGHSCILADGDPTGCLRCGGSGVLDWRNDVLRGIVVIGFCCLMGWMLTL